MPRGLLTIAKSLSLYKTSSGYFHFSNSVSSKSSLLVKSISMISP